MKIIVLGLRGFPGVQGGIEAHAEHLYPLLALMGCEVEVVVRSAYIPKNKTEWQGVRLRRLWAPKGKGIEAFVHTFLGIIYAIWHRPDLLHIHAIGPAIMVPLARLLGLRVIVTHHGPDYDRQKWGIFSRWLLRQSEYMGMRFANERIAISKVVKELVYTKYSRESVLIPNGVDLPALPATIGALEKFGLQPGKYVLLVSRIVPEKRHLDLIEAFILANIPDWKLILVGSSDHPDTYMEKVLSAAAVNPKIVCTGFQIGIALQELYAHAGIFVLPSSHEGLPIALLEALSFGLPTIASDIPANLEVGLKKDQYFPLGNISVLADLLQKMVAGTVSSNEQRAQIRRWVIERYNWQDIARQTFTVYQRVLSEHSRANRDRTVPIDRIIK